jgi:hypothetical protein
MIYIALIVLSTVLFSIQFAFNNVFEKNEGSTVAKSLIFSFGCGAIGLLLSLITGKFQIEFTYFAFFIACISGAKEILLAYISIKVLGIANLSVFSLFCMLGGMVLPSITGIAFYGEDPTWQKGVCAVLVFVALFLGVPRKGGDGANKENTTALARLMYIGVFVLNGLSGVLAVIHQNGVNSVSETSYSALERATTTIFAVAIMAVMLLKGKKLSLSKPKVSVSCITASAILNTSANLILYFALAKGVESSLQYPIVTGGVIIFSLIVDRILGNKVSKNDVIAALISFVALCVLVIP